MASHVMLAVALCFVAGSATGQPADPPKDNSKAPEPLTTAQAVRELQLQDGVKHTAKLKGVVTHVNPHLRDLFLNDDTAGIYVRPSNLANGLKQGDRIEVEGTVSPGTFAPCLVPTAITKLGRGPLPDPEPFQLRANDSRWLDGQYVQVYAFARTAGTVEGYSALSIITSEGIGLVLVPGEDNLKSLQGFLGNTVRIRGVCVPWHDEKTRQIKGRTLIYVQAPAVIKKIPSIQPRLTPGSLGNYLKDFSAVPHPTARPIVVDGVVTATLGDREIFVQDDSGGAHVALAEPARIPVGRKVTVYGFLLNEPSRVLLDNATVTKQEPGELPAPIAATVPLFSKKTLDRVVKVDAVVEKTEMRDGLFLINLRNGPERFQAMLGLKDSKDSKEVKPVPEAFQRLEPESTIRVVGVAHMLRNGKGDATTPVILMRSENDLELLEPPPLPPPPPSWWTTQRITAAFLVFFGVVATGSLWVWLLRRQVGKQTQQIATNFDREAKLSESLRQARKLEAVGRLAGGIAHDFNNLLTVIIGNSELAAQTVRPDDPARDLINTVCDAGEKAASLTRQLLTFSRQDVVSLQPLDLNACIKEVENLLGRLIGEHIRLSIHCTPGLSPVMAESSLVHQILFNLAANARDAMSQGGELTIRTGMSKNAKGESVVRLTVSDTGRGMDDATRARAFEPFFTTKEVGQGTGLGLATVYGTLNTLNGTITIESSIGQGATFVIDLPPLVSAPLPTELMTTPVEPPPRRSAHILLVDDEPAVRDVCKISLEMYGYKVLSSGSPVAAIELARDAVEPIDLVVSDLVMPEMNGQQLGASLRAMWPTLPILFISGYPEEEVARFLGDLKGIEILNKPFSPMHLAIKVQDMLEERSTEPQTAFQADLKPSRLPD